MRLNRFLAAAGLGSRRSCEELILAGEVTINGVVCTTLATQVEPADVVKVGNRVLHTAAPVTILLHKPAGFVCTASDEGNRRTVFDLLPPNFPRLFHVGRLDKESEGLLILTNDGDLSLKLTHPRYKVEKEYEVTLDRAVDFSQTDRLLRGIRLPDGWAQAEAIHKLASNKVKVLLRQGMKRQIRLMFYELGYEVVKLVRIRIGPIRIEGLPLGHWRALTQREISSLVTERAAGEKPAISNRPRPALREEAERVERPLRSARPPRAPQAHRPKPSPRTSGKLEEIPFTPRSSRAAAPGGKFRVKHASRSFESRGEETLRPAMPDRPQGKPSKQFIAKFFAGKGGKSGDAKASGGKQSSGKFAKGRAAHAGGSHWPRSGSGRGNRVSR